MKIMIALATLLLFSSGVFAQTLEDRIRILEEALKKQEQTITEQRKLIEELKKEIKASKPSEQPVAARPKEPLPPAMQEPPKTSVPEKAKEALLPKEGEPKKDIFSYQAGGANLRLIDVSFDGLFAAGSFDRA